MTNYDMIKNMSVEELAVFIKRFDVFECDLLVGEKSLKDSNIHEIASWLGQPCFQMDIESATRFTKEDEEELTKKYGIVFDGKKKERKVPADFLKKGQKNEIKK